ncbi:hypothetical protein F2Q70_00015986 [Brassica cretica]|uniref:Uncharacterized protein n=1 Tax=Brassica cretica TaxID=69181 RepID=A0A8S9HTD3_BRACR|nr:hypothetical protein F2Q70_00015986 [Brassica cretica]
MDQNASTSSFLYALLSLRKKNLETDRLCRWRSIHVSASPRLRLSHLLVSVTPRSLSRLLLQGGAASNAAAAQIPSFFTIWHPLLLSCIDDVSLLVLLLASGIVTENQKNTTVTNQNTISLSLSDESKSTALSDSVDNSPQLISMVLTKRDPMGDPRSDRIDLRRSLDERCKVRARAQRSLGYDLVTVGAANGARETAGDRLAVTGQKTIPRPDPDHPSSSLLSAIRSRASSHLSPLEFIHTHIQPENRTLQISYLSHITSDTATENQKNTTVTDQNTISLSLSDESKSTALTDSVDNSPQAGAVSDETVECSSLLDQIELEFEASGIVTENQKNTTVTDQNTISLSLSDESKSTALSDSVDNSPQLISMVLTKRDPMVSRLTAERRKMLEDMVG